MTAPANAIPTGRVVISLDAGGSFLKSGVVSAAGRLVGSAQAAPSPSDGSARVILDAMAARIDGHRPEVAGLRLAGVAVAMPGPFDYRQGVSYMRGQHKFESLYGVEVGAALSARLPWLAPQALRFVNDAAAFAMGEVRFGAGRNARRVVVITLGTGCGSAFAVGGRLVREGRGVPEDGYVYRLPYEGATLDDWLSKRGVLRLWRELAPARWQGEAQDVADVAALARQGVRPAREVWARFGRHCGLALSGALAGFGPELLVVGGQIARSLDLYREAFEGALAECCGARAPRLVAAADLDGAALLGAASVVFAEA
ncbi:MAG TPA: ROK family protein [Trueperaceae bacterium]